jgi:hypothetical protein
LRCAIIEIAQPTAIPANRMKKIASTCYSPAILCKIPLRPRR